MPTFISNFILYDFSKTIFRVAVRNMLYDEGYTIQINNKIYFVESLTSRSSYKKML